MCADYGFRSGSGRLYQEHYGETPKGVWDLVCAGGRGPACFKDEDILMPACKCSMYSPEYAATLLVQAKNNFFQELNQMRCYTRFGIGATESGPTNGMGKVGNDFR